MEQKLPAVECRLGGGVRPLVERLRTRNGNAAGFGLGPVCDEAADTIERLCAALGALCDAADSTKYPRHGPSWDRLWNAAVEARKALEA